MKKLKATGIICEYNPFHHGHFYHLQQSKAITNCDVLIACMSGNFVQRGECACINKYERTLFALSHGVDIVIELPTVYTLQSANYFAQASTHLLNLMQISDLVFGSETNDIKLLKKYANQNVDIKQLKNKPISTSLAYAQAYESLSPNDILGVNYLKGLKNTQINAHTIKRTNHYHDKNIETEISSATAIRHARLRNLAYQHTTDMNLDHFQHNEDFFPYLKQLILLSSSDSLRNFFLVDEGIESLFKKKIIEARNFEHFVDLCSSKRYTHANIKRTLMHILLQTTKEDMNHLNLANHVRILGVNQTGIAYLKQIKNTTNIVVKWNQLPPFYQTSELKSAKLYSSSYQSEVQREFVSCEIRKFPIVIKNDF